MSVHKEISKHVGKQHLILAEYAKLDRLREQYIEEVCLLCEQGLPYSTTRINEVTAEMNQLAKRIENLPERKMVHAEMVSEYVQRRSSN